MRAGGVGERGRGVPVWQGYAAPPRDARGVAGRYAQSWPRALGRGRRARPPRNEEARDTSSTRVSLALSETRSLRSAARYLGPPLCQEHETP